MENQKHCYYFVFSEIDFSNENDFLVIMTLPYDLGEDFNAFYLQRVSANDYYEVFVPLSFNSAKVKGWLSASLK